MFMRSIYKNNDRKVRHLGSKRFGIQFLIKGIDVYKRQPYYRGGEYDYLLNSDKELDLLHKRFIVFELDHIKDHNILFPITTIIIMEAFINKMRKLKGIRTVSYTHLDVYKRQT